MAIFSPKMRFMKVDFPTFGRPMIATKPEWCSLKPVSLLSKKRLATMPAGSFEPFRRAHWSR